MNEVIRLLKENRVMHLATSYNNQPRVSIMEYGMVGDVLIFATNSESTKSRNIAKNPQVSLSVGSTPQYVTVDGTVTDAGPKEIDGLNKILFERHLLGVRHQVYAGRISKPYEKYPEFRDMLMSGNMDLKYYKVVFDTAYYTSGTGPARIIDMKK